MGRKSLLTAERQKIIVAALSDGLPDVVAYHRASVSKAAFYLWLKKGGEGKEGLYVDFLDEVTRARSVGEGKLAEDWLSYARNDGDWRGIQAYLRARFPERWNPRDEHSGPGGGPIEITDARDRLVEMLERRRKATKEGADEESGSHEH